MIMSFAIEPPAVSWTAYIISVQKAIDHSLERYGRSPLAICMHTQAFKMLAMQKEALTARLEGHAELTRVPFSVTVNGKVYKSDSKIHSVPIVISDKFGVVGTPFAHLKDAEYMSYRTAKGGYEARKVTEAEIYLLEIF